MKLNCLVFLYLWCSLKYFLFITIHFYCYVLILPTLVNKLTHKREFEDRITKLILCIYANVCGYISICTYQADWFHADMSSMFSVSQSAVVVSCDVSCWLQHRLITVTSLLSPASATETSWQLSAIPRLYTLVLKHGEAKLISKRKVSLLSQKP